MWKGSILARNIWKCLFHKLSLPYAGFYLAIKHETPPHMQSKVL